MKKRLLVLLLAMSMLVAMLASCGGGGTSSGGETPVAEKQLVVQVGPNPETLDPALNSAVDGANTILHLFEGLLTVGEDGQLAPGQAESWESSEDGLTWTFHLRDGLKWSDDSDLTANDFVYAWKRICDPEVAAPYADTVLSPIAGFNAESLNPDALQVSAPDDKTFEVKLSGPCTYFGSLAAFATMMPVQQATIDANGDAWATAPETYVSNGPFVMSEWVQGSHITMVKNPNYWNADAVKLDSIKFMLIEDANAAYSAYQNKEVDMIKDVPTEEIPSLTGNPEFNVDTILGTYYLNLNCERDMFKDAKVRKALSLAIDRKYVAETIMQGTYTAAGNFMGPGWADPEGGQFMDKSNGGKTYIDIDNFEANLEEAKKLMAEAGYPNGEGFPEITYTTNEAGYHIPVAEYLQQAWKELGITMKVETVEWGSFTPMRRDGEYEAARNGWVGDYDDPSNMIELLYSTNGNNDGKFKNAEFDAQIDISRNTADPAERSAALHKAEDILMEEAGCVPVAYYNDFWLQSPKIQGSWHSPYGYWHFMFADIAE
ncbi:MAG: peptide ABC transporter substrate-binding protein [Mogibacterium sp.]|nr:peptide ABC transporter substrate-binding protein [Mogibacterium sp.]